MKTVLELIKRAGGWHPGLYLTIDNAPYIVLIIEAMDESGTRGLPAISVAHYGEQNGDAMRDPKMCFELDMAGGPHLTAFYYRNDYAGIEQWSRFIRDGQYALAVVATAPSAQDITSCCSGMTSEGKATVVPIPPAIRPN